MDTKHRLTLRGAAMEYYAEKNRLNKAEQKHFKKLVKALNFLGANPRHPSLGFYATDAMDELSSYRRRLFFCRSFG